MKRALSAVEKVFVAVCFVAILVGLYVVYVRGSRYLREVEDQAHLQLQASVALQRMVADVSLAIDEPAALRAASSSLWILTCDHEASADRFHYDESGHLQWRGWIGFQLEAGKLIRTFVELEAGAHRPPFEGLSPPVAEVRSRANRQVVADSIEQFGVSRAAAGLYTIKVVATLPGRDGALRKTELDTDVYLLNGGVP